jgi:hypothetical protein
MEQSSWSLVEVKNMRVAASCQKEHPAGTVPSKAGIPGGGVSHKAIPIGGSDKAKESVKSLAIS